MLRSVPARRLAAEAGIVGLVTLPLTWVFLGLQHAYLDEPFTYRGDGLYYTMLARLLGHETTYFSSSHLGWPFGFQLYDSPETGDSFHLLLLRVLAAIGSPGFAVNAFYVLSFVLVAVVAHAALRLLGVRPVVAGAVALLYTFTPYHFARNVDHLFLTGYELVPVAVLLAIALLDGDTPLLKQDTAGSRWPHIAWRSGRTWWVVAGCVGLAVTGPYYFVFFLLLIGTAAIARSIGTWRWQPLVAAALMAGIGVGVFAVNLVPVVVYQAKHGDNANTIQRLPKETEVYGLRISQLFLPHQNHRIGPLNTISVESQQSPVVSEDGQQLGLLGSGALAVLLAVFVISAVARGRPGPAGWSVPAPSAWPSSGCWRWCAWWWAPSVACRTSCPG